MSTSMNADIETGTVRVPQIAARIPVGHWGTSEDVVEVDLLLSSTAPNYVTSVIIPVDGRVFVR